MDSAAPELIRAAEVATMLDVSEATVYNLAARDEIPHVRVGKSLRFHREAIVALLERGASRTEAS